MIVSSNWDVEEKMRSDERIIRMWEGHCSTIFGLLKLSSQRCIVQDDYDDRERKMNVLMIFMIKRVGASACRTK